MNILKLDSSIAINFPIEGVCFETELLPFEVSCKTYFVEVSREYHYSSFGYYCCKRFISVIVWDVKPKKKGQPKININRQLLSFPNRPVHFLWCICVRVSMWSFYTCKLLYISGEFSKYFAEIFLVRHRLKFVKRLPPPSCVSPYFHSLKKVTLTLAFRPGKILMLCVNR